MYNSFICLMFLSLSTIDVFTQWQQLTTNTNTSFYAVKFFNQNTGIIAGQDTVGKIFRTVNGGINWTLVYRTGGNEMFECLFFVNDQTGWAGTYSSYVYKTTNGGINWFIAGNVLAGIGRIKAIFFIDLLKGWLISDNGGGKTTDGGITWYLNVPYLSGRAVNYVNALTGLAALNNGTIRRTIDGGNSYNQTYIVPNNNYVYDFHFLNSETGFASGTRKIILKTTNRGENWSLISLDPQSQQADFLYEIFFIDENLGYGAGSNIFFGPTTYYSGIVKKTTNAGLNWTSITVSSEPDAYEGLDITEGQFGYAVGHFNYVYKSSNSGYVGIFPINSQIPRQFSLYQNYPNPFNPSTKIRFDVRDVSDVKLIIYDILGNALNTLVNEQLKPGIYEAEFDAENLTSGVYFYKLSAGEFVETKKMILVK
jgi:photosystem II stability/assembly factor-like uncharacterized protein